MIEKIKIYLLQIKIVKTVLRRFVDWKWKRFIDNFLSDVPEHKKKIIQTLIENQKHYITAGDLHENQHRNFLSPKQQYSIIKKIYNDTLLHDLIGIQCMTAPVGLIYNIQTTRKSTDAAIPEISIELLPFTTEAKSRKLKLELSLELLQDAQARNGRMSEDEVCDLIADNIRAEIESECISKLFDIAAPAPENALTTVHDIMKLSNDIARDSRRGVGNYIICPNEKLAKDICNLNGFTPAPLLNRNCAVIQYVGTIGHLRVYTTSEHYSDSALLGYTSMAKDARINNVDTPYVFAPYVSFKVLNVVANAKTWQPTYNFMTRYGEFVSDKSQQYLKKFNFNDKNM